MEASGEMLPDEKGHGGGSCTEDEAPGGLDLLCTDPEGVISCFMPGNRELWSE